MLGMRSPLHGLFKGQAGTQGVARKGPEDRGGAV